VMESPQEERRRRRRVAFVSAAGVVGLGIVAGVVAAEFGWLL
jgi:hypothetical protein